MADTGEVLDPPAPEVESVGEVAGQSGDEIVALYCGYKQAGQTGTDKVEIVKGDQAFFKLGNGQWKKMSRNIAQWHIGKSAKWDVTQPLALSIKTLEEIQALRDAFQAAKHADADKLAQAAKDAKAAQDKLEADALAAAKVRRDLVDKALGAGVIESSDDAEKLTNQDLADLTVSAKAAKNSKKTDE